MDEIYKNLPPCNGCAKCCNEVICDIGIELSNFMDNFQELTNSNNKPPCRFLKNNSCLLLTCAEGSLLSLIKDQIKYGKGCGVELMKRFYGEML